MRVIRADIGDVYFLHKNLIEFTKDIKQPVDNIDGNCSLWLKKFSDQSFFVLLGMHGKKTIGQIWGYVNNESKICLIEGYFVRRAFRSKFKFIKPLREALNDFLKENGIIFIEVDVDSYNTDLLTRKKFQVSKIRVQRSIK